MFRKKIFLTLLFFTFLLSCASYFKRPYEKGEVSTAYKNNLVFSEVNFIGLETSEKINFIDYIYLGASSREVRFRMKVYFSERKAGKPEVQKDIQLSINPKKPDIILGGKKLSIFEATNDLLIFQIL